MGRADTRGMLAAAAPFGNLSAPTDLMGNVWSVRIQSNLYGSPLLAAAANGQVQAAAYRYQEMQLERSCSKQLWHVIKLMSGSVALSCCLPCSSGFMDSGSPKHSTDHEVLWGIGYTAQLT